MIRTRSAKTDTGFQQISMGTVWEQKALRKNISLDFSHKFSSSLFPNVQMWGERLFIERTAHLFLYSVFLSKSSLNATALVAVYHNLQNAICGCIGIAVLALQYVQ